MLVDNIQVFPCWKWEFVTRHEHISSIISAFTYDNEDHMVAMYVRFCNANNLFSWRAHLGHINKEVEHWLSKESTAHPVKGNAFNTEDILQLQI